MARSLILIKFNVEAWPTDREEVAKVMAPMMKLTQKDLQEGKLKEWGYYVGGGGGYAITEQTPEEITQVSLQMQPYATFEVHQVLSLAELGKLMNL